MDFYHKKTHQDAIWISDSRERKIQHDITQFIISQGFQADSACLNKNFDASLTYSKTSINVAYRSVDSISHEIPEIFTWDSNDLVITDACFLTQLPCQVLSLLPEFWHIWSAPMSYQDRVPQYAYNCFMNRASGERSTVFYELIRRNILDQGLVSYNCYWPGNNRDPSDTVDYAKFNLDQQYNQAELMNYACEHAKAQSLVPYNSVESHAALEQCIIDSAVSLVIETYTSHADIVFSEKLFRVLQLPRPWILYCSPGAVELLKSHGFDTLDEYVDHSYDRVWNHGDRLTQILNQLESFISRSHYTQKDFDRFNSAVIHNQQLLKQYENNWNKKFNSVVEKIKNL